MGMYFREYDVGEYAGGDLHDRGNGHDVDAEPIRQGYHPSPNSSKGFGGGIFDSTLFSDDRVLTDEEAEAQARVRRRRAMVERRSSMLLVQRFADEWRETQAFVRQAALNAVSAAVRMPIRAALRLRMIVEEEEMKLGLKDCPRCLTCGAALFATDSACPRCGVSVLSSPPEPQPEPPRWWPWGQAPYHPHSQRVEPEPLDVGLGSSDVGFGSGASVGDGDDSPPSDDIDDESPDSAEPSASKLSKLSKLP